ncbi:hypothetical protein OL548_16670 [Lysinibacillus sp. MHQ-1]|nr:hypothetical protein OL548_16665 [Lysinibacillus sp. MHQ-1]UZM96967.1 hypothetical protein OL548_16670 [Lysinibacillus sp. MHQ-1]
MKSQKKRCRLFFDQVEAGTLTKEEGMKQLDAALGIKGDKKSCN